MSVPFSAMRVSRFLFLILLALLAFWALYTLLNHQRGQQSIVPHHAQLQRRAAPLFSGELAAGAKV